MNTRTAVSTRPGSRYQLLEISGMPEEGLHPRNETLQVKATRTLVSNSTLGAPNKPLFIANAARLTTQLD